MRLPTFLIIGAPRAGTTALHHWLGKHPDVCMSRPKETQYFSLHHDRGPSWYATCFPHHRGEDVVGESTPVYLTLPHVPKRIAATLPEVRLIAVLREPVEQAYSTWWMLRCLGAERRSFEDAVAAELDMDPLDERVSESYWRHLLEASETGRPVDTGRYLMTGHYVDSINRYLRHFDPDQLTLLLYDDLVRESEMAVRHVSAVVGIDPERAASLRPPRVNQSAGRIEAWARRQVARVPSARVRGVASAFAGRFDRRSRPPLADVTRHELTAYFTDVNAGLSTLAGAAVADWFSVPSPSS